MLETIAVVLIILWLLGLVTSFTVGGFIHIIPLFPECAGDPPAESILIFHNQYHICKSPVVFMNCSKAEA